MNVLMDDWKTGRPAPRKGGRPIIHKPGKRLKKGFTLVEIILVLVVIIIISGIALPYFAGSYRGNKLRTCARSIAKISRYARSMAIMRDETMTVVLNHETMELFVGGYLSASANEADGELDQSVLKRLGYVDDGSASSSTGGIDKEMRTRLPDHLNVKTFDKDRSEEDDQYEDLYLIRFYPNGQCDWFEIEIEDRRGVSIKMEINPVSGRVSSEFLQ